LHYAEAAATMLKNKIHRIPIINKEQRVVGKKIEQML